MDFKFQGVSPSHLGGINVMFKDSFVACVKAGGKILREDKSTVFMPFGSEYSILMKNLESKKAVVSISIDGQDVLDGKKLIVNANSELELERFLEKLDKGNKFRFIEKTAKISEHRGDKIDDGIIRVEFQFEKSLPTYSPLVYPTGVRYGGQSILRSTSFSVSNTTSVSYDSIPLESAPPMAASSPAVTEDGITVKGSESAQQFAQGYVGALEQEKHVITLQIKGVKDSGTVVEQPITVQTKKKCPTCGTTSKGTAKYCSECSTFLE